jgi:glycosyltransferase involved in cell wall biosynthesis
VAALARAIGRLLDEPRVAAAMGARGHERVAAHYSWAAHCAALEGVLDTIRQ